MCNGLLLQVLMMKDNVPAESYKFFIDKLLETIRDEIASCMEKAYERISLAECAKMLQVDKAAAKQLAESRQWRVAADGVVVFQQEERKANENEVPTDELARMSITYAREMEQIV